MRRAALGALILALILVRPAIGHPPSDWVYHGPYTEVRSGERALWVATQRDDLAVSVLPTPMGRTGTPERSPAASGSVSGQTFALAELGPEQFACLDAIVERESHWRVDALNRSSGAYGIPQALPASKMASAGVDWRTNPVTQVRWMLGYVHGRYGSACAAWEWWQAHFWY